MARQPQLWRKYPIHDDKKIQAAKAILLAASFLVKYSMRYNKQYFTITDLTSRPYTSIKRIVTRLLTPLGVFPEMTSGGGVSFTYRINPEEPYNRYPIAAKKVDKVILPDPNPTIDSFFGKYRFLSNFWPAVVWRYPSVENAYQASKCADIDDKKLFINITPGQAKRLGKKVTLRDDFDDIKLLIMEECVREKFTKHADLAQKLLATGEDQLIEGNTWGDVFWGQCGGEGENHLGKILMMIRKELTVDNKPKII